MSVKETHLGTLSGGEPPPAAVWYCWLCDDENNAGDTSCRTCSRHHTWITPGLQLPLHIPEVVKSMRAGQCRTLVLEGKHDVNKPGEGMWTPLAISCASDNADVAGALLKLGAVIEAAAEGGRRPLHIASAVGATDCVEVLLDAGAEDQVFTLAAHDTPLHLASANGHASCVELLFLKRGALSIDAVNSSGQTALHCAARNGHTGVIEVLLRYGARFDIFDSSGWAAQHIAEYWQHQECVEHLLLAASTKKVGRPHREVVVLVVAGTAVAGASTTADTTTRSTTTTTSSSSSSSTRARNVDVAAWRGDIFEQARGDSSLSRKRYEAMKRGERIYQLAVCSYRDDAATKYANSMDSLRIRRVQALGGGGGGGKQGFLQDERAASGEKVLPTLMLLAPEAENRSSGAGRSDYGARAEAAIISRTSSTPGQGSKSTCLPLVATTHAASDPFSRFRNRLRDGTPVVSGIERAIS
jgi:hypothetical protein